MFQTIINDKLTTFRQVQVRTHKRKRINKKWKKKYGMKDTEEYLFIISFRHQAVVCNSEVAALITDEEITGEDITKEAEKVKC